MASAAGRTREAAVAANLADIRSRIEAAAARGYATLVEDASTAVSTAISSGPARIATAPIGRTSVINEFDVIDPEIVRLCIPSSCEKDLHYASSIEARLDPAPIELVQL